MRPEEKSPNIHPDSSASSSSESSSLNCLISNNVFNPDHLALQEEKGSDSQWHYINFLPNEQLVGSQWSACLQFSGNTLKNFLGNPKHGVQKLKINNFEWIDKDKNELTKTDVKIRNFSGQNQNGYIRLKNADYLSYWNNRPTQKRFKKEVLKEKNSDLSNNASSATGVNISSINNSSTKNIDDLKEGADNQNNDDPLLSDASDSGISTPSATLVPSSINLFSSIPMSSSSSSSSSTSALSSSTSNSQLTGSVNSSFNSSLSIFAINPKKRNKNQTELPFSIFTYNSYQIFIQTWENIFSQESTGKIKNINALLKHIKSGIQLNTNQSINLWELEPQMRDLIIVRKKNIQFDEKEKESSKEIFEIFPLIQDLVYGILKYDVGIDTRFAERISLFRTMIYLIFVVVGHQPPNFSSESVSRNPTMLFKHQIFKTWFPILLIYPLAITPLLKIMKLMQILENQQTLTDEVFVEKEVDPKIQYVRKHYYELGRILPDNEKQLLKQSQHAALQSIVRTNSQLICLKGILLLLDKFLEVIKSLDEPKISNYVSNPIYMS